MVFVKYFHSICVVFVYLLMRHWYGEGGWWGQESACALAPNTFSPLCQDQDQGSRIFPLCQDQAEDKVSYMCDKNCAILSRIRQIIRRMWRWWLKKDTSFVTCVDICLVCWSLVTRSADQEIILPHRKIAASPIPWSKVSQAHFFRIFNWEGISSIQFFLLNLSLYMRLYFGDW